MAYPIVLERGGRQSGETLHPMHLPKKKARIVLKVLGDLESEHAITPEIAEAVRSKIEPLSFDWRRLARYSFIVSLSCILIAILTLVFDEAIMRWIEGVIPLIKRLFNAPPPLRCGGLLALSAAFVWLGLRHRSRYPEKIYSTEALFTFGAMAVAAALATLGQMPALTQRGTLLMGIGGLIYLTMGATLASKIIWCYGLLTLSGALGNGTGYTTGCYYLWENTPVLSLSYGLVLVLSAEVLHQAPQEPAGPASGLWRSLRLMRGNTRVVGLLHVFISLWILSIWGSSPHAHHSESFHTDCLAWALLFGVAAAAAVLRSLQKDDSVLRGFGLSFFFINLYTVLFQYFWEGLHKAVFFAILGASFWLLGRKAELLWKMKAPGRKADSP